LRGDSTAALTSLRSAIEQGWRASWWYFLKHDPNFAVVRGEAEFHAMVEKLGSDMADQLSRL
jgi:hypothetical protein